MPQVYRLLSLPLLLLPVGCSNRPLAGTLDCLFPSRANVRPEPPPDGLFRPTDRDPLPPVPDYEIVPPRDVTPRNELPSNGLPRLNEPIPSNGFPSSQERGSAPGAMPLPVIGR